MPIQTSGTNLLDNDTHTLSLGVGFRFPDVLKFFEGRFSVDLTAQLGLMPKRQNIKDTGNDPVGDISAGGNIFSASLMLSYQRGTQQKRSPCRPSRIASRPHLRGAR